MKIYNFKQRNGETHPVTIDPNSRKKFGSLGYMWIVAFTENNFGNYMTRDYIFEATGIDVSKRNWYYNQKQENESSKDMENEK